MDWRASRHLCEGARRYTMLTTFTIWIAALTAAVPVTVPTTGPATRPVITHAELKAKAEAGDFHAMALLGQAYLMGPEAVRNTQAGLELMRKSADHGDSDGMLAWGILLAEGKLIEADIPRGAKWIRKRAAQGNGNAYA